MKTCFTKKEQIVILIVISIIVLILGFKFFSNKLITKDSKNDELVINKEIIEEEKETENSGKEEEKNNEYEGDIIVHISGQVKSPGIVELPSGERLIDAVELLGGLTEHADGNRINLAKKLQDEEKIYIPKIGEVLEVDLIETIEISTDKNEINKEDKDNQDKIDLNTCTKQDLNELPGIGDILSDRIIEYRDNNIFKAIEDIMDVSGIGTKKFEGFKDLIIVK